MIKDIRIRAFRATDDPLTCEKFVFEHKRVLESYGIKQVSSSNNTWIESRSSFAIAVETLEGKLLGGSRIQVADGISPLPIETATGGMDTRIFNIVKAEAIKGTGELCGVWNSKEASGLGIGCYFSIQAAMAICSQIGLTSLFILCAPHTLKIFEQFGGSKMTGIGNEGTFYYPKIDLLTTAMYYDDIVDFKNADKDKREKLVDLIKNLNQTKIETSPKTTVPITIQYLLTMKSIINKEEFRKIYDADFSKIIKPSKMAVYFSD